VEGFEKALGFRLFPPGAVGFEIQNGCPGTISGREGELPEIRGKKDDTIALNGNPLLATITVSTDQSFVNNARGPDLAPVGTLYVIAPAKLCRTSKLDDA